MKTIWLALLGAAIAYAILRVTLLLALVLADWRCRHFGHWWIECVDRCYRCRRCGRCEPFGDDRE